MNLIEVLKPERLTAVVDIGAAPIDGIPTYREMLDNNQCTLLGFEPQLDMLEDAKRKATGPNERYLPHVVADGKPHTLYVASAPGMTSILEPFDRMQRQFTGLASMGKVIHKMEVDTRRLDDVMRDGFCDFLKMDAQGSEMMILEGGYGTLMDAVAVQWEMSFVPLYKRQPSFGAMDIKLRSLGFIPHKLVEGKQWAIEGLNPKEANQVLEADIVYTRDWSFWPHMTPEQWKHLAILATYAFKSYDLGFKCLSMLCENGHGDPSMLTQYKNQYGVPENDMGW